MEYVLARYLHMYIDTVVEQAGLLQMIEEKTIIFLHFLSILESIKDKYFQSLVF